MCWFERVKLYIVSASKSTYLLGSGVDSDTYCDSEIHRRLGIASSTMGQLDNVWRQQRLSLSTQLRIYVSLVHFGGAIRL